MSERLTAPDVWASRGVALPEQWYNVLPDLPFSVPAPLHPDRDEPLDLEDFAWLWPRECLRIELRQGPYGSDAWIDIPAPVLREYGRYRPTPLVRARGLEQALGTCAEIYYKREDLNPGGSHKINTALGQAFYAHREGFQTLVTDTGAGQWGTALAMACRNLGMSCVVFMIRKSYDEKPYRRYLMRIVGAEVVSSPSPLTEVGRRLLATDPDNTGSLGIGMSEAIEYVRSSEGARLALGCMSYYAVLHQSVIGIETRDQLEQLDRSPDVMIGCVGGGSNFTGFVAPFVRDKLEGRAIELVAVEPDTIPCLTRGTYRHDWADFSGLTPRVCMYTLGNDFVPPSIHSGGLRYHGKTPILSALVRHGVVSPRAYGQEEVFAAGEMFLRTEGILPAPESAHAVLAAIEEARQATRERQRKVIVFCLSGNGYLDLKGYADVLHL